MNKKGIIFILEDNKNLLATNIELLQDESCEVYGAASIEEARKILQTITPDVAILDIRLPDGNGIEFASELREMCNASIIFLTAKTSRRSKLAGFAEGAVQYITKPYDVETFRLSVMNLLSDIVSSRTPDPASLLEDFELDTARLAATGMLCKNIADKLCVSERAIKQRLTTMYHKLGITEINDLEKRRVLKEILDL